MKLVKSVKAAFAVSAAAGALFGLCLFIWPDLSAGALCVAIGALMLLSGVIRLTGYFSNDIYRLAFQFDLAAGLLSMLVGGVLIFRRSQIMFLLPVIVGIVVLMDSVLRLQTALDARHFGMEKWWLILAAAAVGALIGLLLLVRPLEGGRLLRRVTGLSLMAHGAEDLITVLYAVKAPRRASAQRPIIETSFRITDED